MSILLWSTLGMVFWYEIFPNFLQVIFVSLGVASVYENLGDAEEDDIRHWIMEHKTDERIEMVAFLFFFKNQINFVFF